MADSVTKWDRGNAPTAGSPSTGYHSVDFKWNTGSGTSHAAVTSDSFSMHHDEWTVHLNSGAIALSNNIVYSIMGSNDSDLADAKWHIIKTATVTNAGITELVYPIHICHTGTEVALPRFKHYKIKLDPSANPGSDIVLKVSLVPGKH